MSISSPNRHIVFFVDYFYPHVGGHEYLFYHLAQGLVEKGYEVSVITARYDPKLAQRENIPAPNGEIHVFRTRGTRFSFGLRETRKIQQILKSADLIHTSTITSALQAKIWSWRIQKPIVLTVHEVFGKSAYRFWGPAGFLLHMHEKITLACSYDATVAVSEHTRARISKRRQAIRICNGILPSPHAGDWKPHNREEIKIGYFGRNGKTKGVQQILPTLEKWTQKHPQYRFDLYTGKPQKKANIHFRNHVDSAELETTMLSYDAIIVPSLSEGFGLSALLACSLGIPIICSNRGALPEVVSGDVYFFDPDNVQSIWQALENYTSRNTTPIPKKIFPIEKTIEEYARIYATILKEKATH